MSRFLRKMMVLLLFPLMMGAALSPYGVFGGPIPSSLLPANTPSGTWAFTSNLGAMVSNGTTWVAWNGQANLLTCAATQIVFDNASNQLACSSNFTWKDSTSELTLSGTGPSQLHLASSIGPSVITDDNDVGINYGCYGVCLGSTTVLNFSDGQQTIQMNGSGDSFIISTSDLDTSFSVSNTVSSNAEATANLAVHTNTANSYWDCTTSNGTLLAHGLHGTTGETGAPSLQGCNIGTDTSLWFSIYTNKTERIGIAGDGSLINLKATSIQLGGNLLASETAPSIASGFGSSPSVTQNNGPASFSVNVGTGGSASSGVVTLPAAAHAWACSVADVTTQSTSVFLTKQTATGTTSVTFTNYNTAGAATAWAASDVLQVSCWPN